MAMPMRRSSEGLGGEPCMRRTWCSDISQGPSSMTLALEVSTSTATSWPRVRRLFFEKVSRLHDLRDLSLLLPRLRQLVRAQHAVHQHDSPPPHLSLIHISEPTRPY